jgi:DUF4097 and DUF4098 domain-containing protein YvlB
MSNNNRSAAIVKLVIWSAVALILIAIFVLMLVMQTDGIISFGSGFHVSSRIYYEDAHLYNVGNITYSDEVKNIDVDWSAGKIDVVVWDGDAVKLEESGHGDIEQNKMRSRVDGNTLRIKFAKSGLKLSEDEYKKSLVIYIPKDIALTLGEIDIAAAAAEVTVGDSETAEAIVIACRHFELNSASGSVKLNGVEADEVCVNAAAASVEFVGNAKEINVAGVSGVLSLSGEADDISVEAVSSSVHLNLDNMPNEINVETVSGDVDISLPDDENGFVAELDSLSGNMKYNSNKVGHYYTAGRGSSDFDFETVSGSVSIKTRTE